MEKSYKYRYIYKITCLKGSLAGHYYYGQHQTNDLNDGYAGSGRIICDYYKKYGRIEHQTYIKEIIAFYNSVKELNQAEFELIGDKYNTDQLCLNLRAGGGQPGFNIEVLEKRSKHKRGGWKLTNEQKKHLSDAHKGIIFSDEHIKHLSEVRRGRRLSDEWKRNISISGKGKHSIPSPIKGKHRVYREDGSFYFE